MISNLEIYSTIPYLHQSEINYCNQISLDCGLRAINFGPQFYYGYLENQDKTQFNLNLDRNYGAHLTDVRALILQSYCQKFDLVRTVNYVPIAKDVMDKNIGALRQDNMAISKICHRYGKHPRIIVDINKFANEHEIEQYVGLLLSDGISDIIITNTDRLRSLGDNIMALNFLMSSLNLSMSYLGWLSPADLSDYAIFTDPRLTSVLTFPYGAYKILNLS